jgi:hypothetical protein
MGAAWSLKLSFSPDDDDDDDDVYLYKIQQEDVTKSIVYTLPYRPAKKA